MNSEPFNKWNLLGIAGNFAFLIGFPLIALILLGQWLDAKQGTEYFVVLAIPVAVAVSSFMIYRKIREIKKHL